MASSSQPLEDLRICGIPDAERIARLAARLSSSGRSLVAGSGREGDVLASGQAVAEMVVVVVAKAPDHAA
jgi:hypothetical protein